MQIAEFNLTSRSMQLRKKKNIRLSMSRKVSYGFLSFMKYRYLREPLSKKEKIEKPWIYP